MTNLLILGSHSILEYDDLRLFTDLGYDVFQPGGYANPSQPGEKMRPALPHAPHHPELEALCVEQREKHAGQSAEYPIIDWAKADLHPKLIDWADIIMVNCFPESWIALQWDRIREKRVIWRTIGQSGPLTEHRMAPFRAQGLQIVRMSPKERSIPGFAGEDAVIRFAKYPADFGPWIAEGTVGFPDGSVGPYIGNITQDMAGRGNACGLDFWLAATQGLPAVPAGPQSELLPGGIGALGYDEMREYLRRCRAYLYVGTVPAPYTLGLIEAMLTGVPVVSIGPEAWAGPAELFEAREITVRGSEDPQVVRGILARLLEHPDPNPPERQRAIDLFSADTIGPQWLDFLGEPTMSAAQVERRLAGAAA